MEVLRSIARHRNVKPVQDAVSYLFDPSDLATVGAGSRRGRMRNSRYFDRYFHIGLTDDDVSDRKTERALSNLLKGESGHEDVSYLTSVICGLDDDLAVLALDIARVQRARSDEASLAMLGYLSKIRESFEQSEERQVRRVSAIDRWIGEEIRLALEMKVCASGEMVSQFGYTLVFSSAYMAQRSHRYEDDVVKALYSPVARHWVNELGTESIQESLVREELIAATSFCIWIADIEDHRGFLAQDVTGPESLVNIAVAYVGYSEWHGSGVKYDLSFREQEFRFAVGEALTRPLMTSLFEYDEYLTDPDYEASGHRSRDWTPAQHRDFAVRSLHSLRM